MFGKCQYSSDPGDDDEWDDWDGEDWYEFGEEEYPEHDSVVDDEEGEGQLQTGRQS